ncbi:VIT-domain-containing protein [Cucurbitaria berberidis CBS 394.84]|uniref:VIT-domain-containing protein n=1 Tax=Cucurbitaria berberidis CBS 394.84 TaxID=1168544 RepID=A0A9P4LAY2_9PLEO|nr:VIT-domain-containing protein [Cucurbitaria berberidis CBS 394.84]KAF1848931.1 VIT-domain-containing protein [Cucurbitaria berberidis CBS 394.84]
MSLFNFNASGSHQPAWRDHICGLYYSIPCQGYLQKRYLPQVELQAHATILAATSRTALTQTFVNPSTEKGIKEVRYTFPLYDGVSVVGFTCHVGDRTIVGEVKEKEKAKAVFREAVARGETAGLLEQLPDAADVFTTSVGNIPPGARVIIKITYLGELKHDMEVDGIRFTIPNIICPRYGEYHGNLQTSPAADAVDSSISITVDAEMAEGSFIQKIQSPTHPISMTMGTTSLAPNAEPTMLKASATLTLGTAQLDTDFVLQVVAKDTGVPKAVLENHPTIARHRALMATLVPKFALPAEKPEVVFVCDRSGSMAGSRMKLVIQALKVFLKSLPVGVKFNVCSFGSSHSFLWPKSVTYSQETLDAATRHADTFSANYGGTEMLYPLKATIDQRYKDMSLEVVMLTDGEIWNQQALFTYLNQSITDSKAPIRIFTLGIGNGVSHSLIEGVARAGNGFSQTVGEGEQMDSKVVRMLKGALSPHINDYTLEVKYSNSASSDEEDDFEIIERVTDSLKIKLDLGEKKVENITKKPISLFDPSVDLDKQEPSAYDETGEGRYAHLPEIPAPRVLQAPQNIPSLFAFNRTTVYLLLGPDAPKATPKSVVLRGTSAHGPLELEIPIQILDVPGETIHQLAAKKAISELEQGRGWLPEAKDEAGSLIKTQLEGRFDDMIEREAVRLGVQFQVGGKWCSFVAVESKKRKAEDEKRMEKWDWLEDEAPEPPAGFGGGVGSGHHGHNIQILPQLAQQQQLLQQQQQQQQQQQAFSSSLFGSYVLGSTNQIKRPAAFAQAQSVNSTQSSGGKYALQDYQAQCMILQQQNDRLFILRQGVDNNQQLPQAASTTSPGMSPGMLFGSAPQGTSSHAFGAAAPAPAPAPAVPSMPAASAAFGITNEEEDEDQGFGLFDSGTNDDSVLENFDFDTFLAADEELGPGRDSQRDIGTVQDFGSPSFACYSPTSDTTSTPTAETNPPSGAFSVPSAPAPAPKTLEELLHYLIDLQTFEGSWEWSDTVVASIQSASVNLDKSLVERRISTGVHQKHLATAIVVVIFEVKLLEFKGSWELVVDKARAWLEAEVGDAEKVVESVRMVVL